MKHDFRLEFSPNLITLLGEQLIHDKKIAIAELVKNAYDADASQVIVDVNSNCISISDNGCGMDINTVKNVWLKPGITSKNNMRTGKPTPKYKRMPIGEKGVGRLGSHKLGKIIELYTKAEDCKEIYLKINWEDIEKAKNLSDMPSINVTENVQPKEIKKATGTKLLITNLKEKWSDKDYEELSKDLTNLISPFDSKDSFEIIFKKEGEIFQNNLSDEVKMIKKNALFEFDISIENGLIKNFEYRFKPWLGLEKVKSRTITLSKNRDLLDKVIGKQSKYLSLDKKQERFKKIGEINFKGVIYDFDNSLWIVQNQIDKKQKKSIKEYMKSNGGVRVYRDNFRIFNYGEYGDDILELDLERVNRPAGRISSNQILASIQLNRKTSSDLIEKTNREGFIHNQAFTQLQETLKEITFNVISIFRQDDKTKITKAYLDNAQDRMSVEKKITDIKQLVENSDIKKDAKKKIVDKLEQFSKDFNRTKEVFLSAANTGLNLAIVVHEVGHLIKILNKEIGLSNWDKVKVTSDLLQTTIKNYSDIIRLDKKNKQIPIKELIEMAIFNAEIRFKQHRVNLVIDISDELSINIKKNLIAGVITNLFDNSLYWLNQQKIEDKKIIIKTYKKDGQIHLVIADNGLGFTVSFESAVMPFITGRKDESSMGIGLYLAEQVMIAHQGLLKQGSFDDEELPPDFKNGAIIKLIFKE